MVPHTQCNFMHVYKRVAIMRMPPPVICAWDDQGTQPTWALGDGDVAPTCRRCQRRQHMRRSHVTNINDGMAPVWRCAGRCVYSTRKTIVYMCQAKTITYYLISCTLFLLLLSPRRFFQSTSCRGWACLYTQNDPRYGGLWVISQHLKRNDLTHGHLPGAQLLHNVNRFTVCPPVSRSRGTHHQAWVDRDKVPGGLCLDQFPRLLLSHGFAVGVRQHLCDHRRG